MRFFMIITFFIGMILSASTSKQDPKQNSSVSILRTGNQKFAAVIYKKLLQTNGGAFVFSPLSAEIVLALAAEGARGETRNELLTALKLPKSFKKVRHDFKNLLPRLKIKYIHGNLTSANKIYAANDIKLKNEFKAIAIDIYESDIENVDFSKNIDAAKAINGWIENQTNSKIKDLINPATINKDTALVLVNTLYLTAGWRNKFRIHRTSTETFYKNSTETREVPFMSQTENLDYYKSEDLDAQFLRMKFKSRGLSMIIALPNKMEGLAYLESHMEAVFRSQVFKQLHVDVKLPKFIIDTKIDFVSILKSMGVRKMFSDADFSGLTVRETSVNVSQIAQKAYIDVNENGIEAAAASEVVFEGRSLISGFNKNAIKFHANHPFAYVIKLDGAILFAGKYT